MNVVRFIATLGLAALFAARLQAQSPPADSEFFEKRIRPLLVAKCVSCHGALQPGAGIRLDRPIKAAVAKRLVVAVNQTGAIKMPPTGKLPTEAIADLEAWVKAGSVWSAPSPAPLPLHRASGEALRGRPERGSRGGGGQPSHWSLRPVRRQLAPPIEGARTDIDAFVLAKLGAKGLTFSPAADRRTWLRRVTFDLTGLPPTPSEVQAFLADRSPLALERVVDRLLSSPRYGERWGRHWLDLVRYGESMGHEFDFDIPFATGYRDYVIRALNADLPFDRFVQEHLAGDLLPDPRLQPGTGRNESILGTGFFWIGEGKHSPVDVRQEQADRIDNQIDVFGKAFLAQTLACTRCHDHKFDPIPTTDYYALYGIFKSSRFQFAQIDRPETFQKPAEALGRIQASVDRNSLFAFWRERLANVPDTALTAAVNAATAARKSPLVGEWREWRATGEAFATPASPGDLVFTGDPNRPVAGVLATAHPHSALRSRRFEGALRSPDFTIDKDFLHLRLAGRASRVHVIVENFQVIRDPIYGPLTFGVDSDALGWRTIDLRLWKGRRAYIELSDLPLDNLSLGLVGPLDKPHDGWVRLDAVQLSDAPKPAETAHPLAGKTAEQIRTALREGEPDLAVLDRLLASGALSSDPVADTARQVAAIEGQIPIPTRALAMTDGPGQDEKVFVRGSHRSLGALAPRLNLTFCGWQKRAPATKNSGRLELAQRLTDGTHPLTARVIVNRIWKHHFGVGIVASTDDFGKMGEAPTHPELLDYLADTFVRDGWSLKRLHRRIVLSDTYRQSSAPPSARAAQRDPRNALLHRMPVRRLEAEAIRDALLAVSGRLDTTMYGPSIPNYLTEFVEGRGRPASGPLDGDGRRSIYQAVRRNFLSPFALAFDFPVPFSCMGRRSVSNVPAQALAMLNGAFVRQQADVWRDRLLREKPDANAAERIGWLYETAFSRLPTASESQTAASFVAAESAEGASEADAWAALCHVLFNVKEFVFVR